MTETLDTANEIKTIRFRLDTIEGTLQLMLRKDASAVLKIIRDALEDDPILARIYDAVDGHRTQRQIVEFLTSNGVQCSEPTVSRRVDVLDELGLIEKVADAQGAGVVWAKNANVERSLHLSRELKRAGLLG